MKNLAKLSNSVLSDHVCRKFISSLWNQDLAEINLGFFPKDYYPSDIWEYLNDENFDFDQAFLFDSQEKQNQRSLLNFLIKQSIVEFHSQDYETGEQYLLGEGEEITTTFKLKNRETFKPILIWFANSTVEEPLGKDKQRRILKECLKVKYKYLENPDLKLKWTDIPEGYRQNFEIISALLSLDFEGYISLDLSRVNLLVNEIVLDQNGRPQALPCKYGSVDFEANITISMLLITEWIRNANIEIDPVIFDEKTGELVVEGKYINFCNPNNKISKLMKKLVDNINSIVSHDEIGMITLELSKNDLIKKRKLEGSDPITTKNKDRIKEIKEKIKTNNLSEVLEIKSKHGYGLTFKRSTISAESVVRELINSETPF